MLLAALIMLSITPYINCIMCYESGSPGIVVSSENFRYCVYHPPTTTHPLKVYGIGALDEADQIDDFRSALERKYDDGSRPAGESPTYNVQSVCILENFEFGPLGLGLEGMFRCFCTGHLCNTPATFSAFLGANAGNITFPMGHII
ncbi:hypothetical protein QR680_000781 [Steinernema hermaphroditum]|uniref:Uncharacterized protein n=1 Tax=Steinernema hermaphroditum TaxID=289476 RepID=A0AA39GXD5_9BILA|nr:hypothetical protein QR680_000781 [Steinernema hermaphroditum]